MMFHRVIESAIKIESVFSLHLGKPVFTKTDATSIEAKNALSETPTNGSSTFTNHPKTSKEVKEITLSQNTTN